MERFTLPPIPPYLAPLPPAPPLESLESLPAPLADWSTLKPLPGLNGIKSIVLPKDLRKSGNRRGETPSLSTIAHGQIKVKTPLEEFFWNLRSYNEESSRSANAAELILVDGGASDDDGSQRDNISRLGLSWSKNMAVGQTTGMWHSVKETNMRGFRARRVHSELMRQAITDGPGGMTYEARFAIRNGKWRRGTYVDKSESSILPSSFTITARVESPQPLRQDSDVSLVRPQSPESSPMSICSTLETPILLAEVPAPADQDLVPSVAPILPDSSKSFDITPILTPSPSSRSRTATSSPLSSIISPRDEDMQIIEAPFKPLEIRTNLPATSPVSSICSTPRLQRPSELIQDCPLITPITPTTFSFPNMPDSTLQLDIFGSSVESPSLFREDSPIPGLFGSYEFKHESPVEDASYQEVDHLPRSRSMSPLDLSEGEAELLGPPTEYHSASRSRTPRSAKSLVNSLFDGDLSEEDTSTMTSVYSEPLVSDPPLSPLSTRPTIRPPNVRKTRTGNIQQLPTPSSSSPSPPFTRQPYWFSGPRPLFPLQTPKIRYSDNPVQGKSCYSVYGASTTSRSMGRRSSRITGSFDPSMIGGSVDGLTQFIGTREVFGEYEEHTLARKDLKAIAQNTIWAMQAAEERDGDVSH